jgi:hypothetical protein
MLDIEAFLSSGAFVKTDQGPHFCQPGHLYVMTISGVNYTLKASEVTVINGKETVIFSPVDIGGGPMGIVSNLEMITDLEEPT